MYSHRNGETTPPTIFNEWYWYHSNDDAKIFAEGVFWIDPEGYLRDALNPESKAKDWEALEDLHGQWWGPVTPPWAEQANPLAPIVAQLRACGYVCEGGSLENNADFRLLEKMAK